MRQEQTQEQQPSWKHDPQQIISPPVVAPTQAEATAPQTVTESSDTLLARQIALLEQKATAATSADEIKKYFDIIQEVQRQAQELEQAPLLAERQAQQSEKQASETRVLQVAAAVICTVPGLSLIASALYLRDASLTVAGGPLIAIGAAALSERVASVTRVWLGRRGSDNDKNEQQ